MTFMFEVVLYLIAGTVALYLLICAICYFLQESFIFFPSRYSQNYAYDLAADFEELFLSAPEKGEINALLLKVENPHGLIIYFHGNTGSLNRWAYMAEELTHYGYHVLAVDYRGYGKSKGKRSEAVLHSDAQFVLDYVNERFKDLPVVLYGRSLGTGLAVKLASRNNVEKLVLETPYHSLLHVGKYNFPFLPVKLLLRYVFRSDEYIQDVRCPLIIFHGTKDRIVPFSSAMKLYHLVSEKDSTEFVTIVGGKHNNLNAFPLFNQKLKNFLEPVSDSTFLEKIEA